MNVIEAVRISKSYQQHVALKEVSLQVPEGSVFGMLGPNGAGKTSLIRIMNQITAPDTGELLFKGRRISSEDVESIGYLPEERGLYRK
ncbi:MAG: ATP-binding cassette domain-containing protein, partial [Flavobacteriales bacterium]